MEDLEKIRRAYLDFVASQQHRPSSVYDFMKNLELSEKDFYQHFSSFLQLESQIWATIFEETCQKISSEQVYENYSVREKILGLYFTLLEELKNYRTFAGFSLNSQKNTWSNSFAVLDLLKDKFDMWVSDLLAEGIQNGEIEDRTFLSERYIKVLWWQMVFILKFWLKDHSPNFEKTDAAVEKSVHLALDMLGKNVADTAFDFMKFLFQK